MTTRPVSVLLADDHAMVAEALSRVVREEFELVGVVGDGIQLLEAARRLRPNVIVVDISMPKLGGLAALRALRAEGNQTPVVILTMHDDPALATESLKEGAQGYVLKDQAAEELIVAIREAACGRAYVSPQIARATPKARAPSAKFSVKRSGGGKRDVPPNPAKGS